MIYVDTSVWVALLTPEPASDRVEAWFADNSQPLVSADWTLTEFHSAIAIKRRTGQVTVEHADTVLTLFDRLGAGAVTWLPISRMAYRVAAAWVDDYPHGLRGADALHLAVAKEAGVRRFATLDRNQARNARRLDITLVFTLVWPLPEDETP